MKKIFLLLTLTITVSSVCFAQSAPDRRESKNTAAQPIEGWRVPVESDRRNYDVYLDRHVRYEGAAGASIKSKAASADESGKTAYLFQTVRADNYREKRVRLSVYAKSENAGRAALWLRMDGDAMTVLNLDRMDDRPIKGTSDWRRYDLVLDVPKASRQIVFGVNLKGGGQIWVDDVKFEEVGQDVPVTSAKSTLETERASARRIEQYKTTNKEDYEKQLKAFSQRNVSIPTTPVNLDFEN